MIDYFDPSYWGISPEAYAEWWFYLVSNLFFGFVPRLLASLCLIVSVFSSVTRRFRPAVSIFMFMLAFLLTYFGTFIGWMMA